MMILLVSIYNIFIYYMKGKKLITIPIDSFWNRFKTVTVGYSCCDPDMEFGWQRSNNQMNLLVDKLTIIINLLS